MIKVKVFVLNENEERKEVYSYSSKCNLEEPFNIVREIEALQNEHNFLGIGAIGHLGIKNINIGDKIIDSLSLDSPCGELVTGKNSAVLGMNVGTTENQNNPVSLENGESIDLYLSFTAYESGLVLNTGVESQSFWGNYDAYLKKITSKNMLSGPLKYARVFNTYKALFDYIKKHEAEFKYCVDNWGHQYTVKTLHDGPVQKKNDAEYVRAISELIKTINTKDEAEDDTFEAMYPLPESLDNMTILQEAYNRL